MPHPKPTTFSLFVSLSDFVIYFGEGDDDFLAHPLLDAVTRTIGLRIDIRKLYDDYFCGDEDVLGHTHVFHGLSREKDIFVLDLRPGDDQLDIVHLAVICSPATRDAVRYQLRSFFDAASCPISYHESHGTGYTRNLLDANQYPGHDSARNRPQELKYAASLSG